MKPGFPIPDQHAIKAELKPLTRPLLRQLTVLATIDSTNRFLARLPSSEQHGHAVLADHQTAGQGRRGRNWHSPAGSNIYLSLGWAFAGQSTDLARLPLAVAVCIARALKIAGVENPGIKWPNDLQIEGRKVAGTLLELKTGRQSGAIAVIGIGVNVSMPAGMDTDAAIRQEWTDLGSHVPKPFTGNLRDRFCGLLLGELLAGLEQFAADGFDSFKADWLSWDVLKGRSVSVVSQNERYSGKAAGISRQGGLLLVLETEHGGSETMEFFAGDVSVRS